jgi:hypothetical protein
VARTDMVLVGVVVLAVAGVLALIGWLLWPNAGDENFRIAQGTVLQQAQCGPPDARDVVRLDQNDGRTTVARLDGCGNRPGEVLTVEVPDPLPGGDVVVRLAGTGVPATAATGQRLAAVLAGSAGIAGAVLAWRLHHGRVSPPGPVAVPRRRSRHGRR